MPRLAPRRAPALLATAAVTLVGGALLTPVAQAAPAASAAGSPRPAAGSPSTSPVAAPLAAGRYIVQLADRPLAAYEGGVRGLARTRPQPGAKVDPTSAASRAYTRWLATRQNRVLATVRGARVTQRYGVAFNGFTAVLTAQQAQRLARTPGVLALSKDTRRTVDTTQSPAFLNLSGSGGLWSKLGGQSNAGRGVIVGIVDSGLWPENPAFTGARLRYGPDGEVRNVPGWRGVCETGPEWGLASCSTKVVGARFYVDGYGAGNISPDEFLSPRDGDGHGSHTASTAAGNAGQAVTIDGRGFGTASGMAPAASIAVYKVCWEGRSGIAAGCFSSDSVKAIDDAVADGVDVINFSISGSPDDVLDPVEVAFLGAAAGNVFVAASAGNEGPDPSTVNHPAPWVTTVAASTFKILESTVELGNGEKVIGTSVTPGLATLTPLVLASTAGIAGATADEARLCTPDKLDPAKVTGTVVVCDRGVVARVDKSAEVKRAGGVGMILTNTSVNSLDADLHTIPTVHLDETGGATVKAYIATEKAAARTPTAKILAGVNTGTTTKVPEVAGFSSRGPSLAESGNLLKPDVSAPGVSVIAAVAPPFNSGRSWDFYSGTSMASPHIAGIAALLRQAHPRWSPMMIKSAIMTSARDHASATSPFAQGAGFVQPAKAVDPGLVLDSGVPQWLGLAQGICGCVSGSPPVVRPSDVNLPSIAFGDLVGSATTSRTFTSVATAAETYTVTVAGLAGVTATVTPKTFTVSPGGSAKVTVSITKPTIVGSYTTGTVTLTSAKHTVRVPVVVQPQPISAPAEVAGTRTAGAGSIAGVTVRTGFAGSLAAAVRGLVPGVVTASSVQQGDFDPTAPAEGPATKKLTLSVPAGSTLARFDVNAANNDNDLDLFVYKDGQLVGVSATGSADEQVTLLDPTGGTYEAYVNGFGVSDSGTFDLTTFVVGSAAAGNATVSPTPQAVTVGGTASFTVSYSGLSGAPYLGWVQWLQGSTEVGRTVVSVP